METNNAWRLWRSALRMTASFRDGLNCDDREAIESDLAKVVVSLASRYCLSKAEMLLGERVFGVVEFFRLQSERLNEPRRDLMERFWPLARKLSKQYRRAYYWLADEIDGEVAVAMARLVHRLKPGYEAVLPRLMRKRIPGACVDAIRKEQRKKMSRLPSGLACPKEVDSALIFAQVNETLVKS